MLKITKEELFNELMRLSPDDLEACPLTFKSFIDYLFHKYQPERLSPEDHIDENSL